MFVRIMLQARVGRIIRFDNREINYVAHELAAKGVEVVSGNQIWVEEVLIDVMEWVLKDRYYLKEKVIYQLGCSIKYCK